MQTTKQQAKKIVKKYAQKLTAEKFPFSKVYLFGSYAQGKANKWSDLDVAIVSDEIKKDWDGNRKKLWKLRMGIDTRIEPHGFSQEEFESDWSPMIYEIKKTGVPVSV